MELSIENLAFIGILFVALVALWALVRSNIVIANLVPVELAQALIKSAVETALDAAQKYAESTPTKTDDELVALIRAEASKVMGQAIAAILPENKVASARPPQTATTVRNVGNPPETDSQSVG